MPVAQCGYGVRLLDIGEHYVSNISCGLPSTRASDAYNFKSPYLWTTALFLGPAGIGRMLYKYSIV